MVGFDSSVTTPCLPRQAAAIESAAARLDAAAADDQRRSVHDVTIEQLGIARKDGGEVESDPRKIWQLFASNWHLFRGTPTRLWFEHAAFSIFGMAGISYLAWIPATFIRQYGWEPSQVGVAYGAVLLFGFVKFLGQTV